MLQVEDLFKNVISTVETSLAAAITLLSCLLCLRPGRAPLAITAARLERRGEHVSGRTLLFFSSVNLLIATFYTRLPSSFSEASSAFSSGLTTTAITGLVLTAGIDRLVRVSVGRSRFRARRLTMLRDGISCWLFVLSLLYIAYGVVLHDEYWATDIIRMAKSSVPATTVVSLLAALATLYLFVPLVLRPRGTGRRDRRRRFLPMMPVLLLGPATLVLSVVGGIASWEIDRDRRGHPNISIRADCWLSADNILHTSVELRNVGREPLWVQDPDTDQIRTYVGGVQSERFAGHPIHGGVLDATHDLSIDPPYEGLIDPGKTMVMRGETDMPIEEMPAPGKLWTCEYAGPRVARLNELPSRGVIRVRRDNPVPNGLPVTREP